MVRRSAFTVSILIHILLLYSGGPGLVAPRPLEIPVERWIDVDPQDEGQIVESEKGKDEAPAQTKFFSERNQTVKQERRAAVRDAFRSGRSDPSEAAQSEAPRSLTLGDLGLGGWRGGHAAADDRLEDVVEGQQTLLNTREHRYYSFYKRVEDALRPTWKREVRARAAGLAAKGLLPGNRELVTRVIVLLDAEGVVSQTITSRRSGQPYIDGAAGTAFFRVGKFPNPPKAMIDADGYARLHWEFVLKPTSGLRLADQSDLDRAGRMD